jgi:hypothetical protein
MASDIKNVLRVIWLILCVEFLTICKDNKDIGDSGITYPTGDISMIAPYVNSSDISYIYEAFSSGTNPAWGFSHGGIDFGTNGNLKQFQSVSSGFVEEIKLWQNNITSNWQVNVRIKYNSTYSVEYTFEPISLSQSDGQTQYNNISISAKQYIAPGTIIGKLYNVGSGAHVDFSLKKNQTHICPEPYFTSEAKNSILSLIHKDHPTWNMCY